METSVLGELDNTLSPRWFKKGYPLRRRMWDTTVPGARPTLCSVLVDEDERPVPRDQVPNETGEEEGDLLRG